ncbi:hypothetical protein N7470_010196 [Penicillium chermesinum]|nr:hypothetical protein N7470_010196 [Penicillium chermesinum]
MNPSKTRELRAPGPSYTSYAIPHSSELSSGPVDPVRSTDTENRKTRVHDRSPTDTGTAEQKEDVLSSLLSLSLGETGRPIGRDSFRIQWVEDTPCRDTPALLLDVHDSSPVHRVQKDAVESGYTPYSSLDRAPQFQIRTNPVPGARFPVLWMGSDMSMLALHNPKSFPPGASASWVELPAQPIASAHHGTILAALGSIDSPIWLKAHIPFDLNSNLDRPPRGLGQKP